MTDWKVVRVTPIHKSGAEHCMSNYRLYTCLDCCENYEEADTQPHFYVLTYLALIPDRTARSGEGY